jgi:transposase InsO family protein
VIAAEGLPVERACALLGVSVSGCYGWLRRAPSARSIRHAWLTEIISGVHAGSRQTYGAKRVHAELTLGRGIAVCRQTVETLMRQAGLRGISGRSKHSKNPNVATALDLVDRDFARTEPDRLWVTDITEHPTREGKVYCAVVLDTFSRRVVGWSIDSRPAASLVTNALGMAIDSRRPAADQTVIHSDQGTQFTSWAFTQRAIDPGLLPSMGSVGDCFDNAMIESFWSRMQVELLDRKRWHTRIELANAIFEYLEIWHNRQRRHTSLGMLTPVEFETRHQHQPAA